MKSSFKYEVDRDDNNKITSRAVAISVKGINAEEVFDKLADFIRERTGYEFSGCPWENKDQRFPPEYGDCIVVDDKEESDCIKKAYKEFKSKN